ncbi:MAG TPA: MarR family transcriptional regulator [Steroidobacteraceae bacterium]|nr:MarR family transcriptional regulator [Steroidobacteraceae bacterium]
MSIPRNMNPAEPDFDLFSSPFYLIAHVDFKYHEDLDRVMRKYEVDRTTYRLMSVLLAVGLENIKVICEHALVKRSTGSRAIDRMLEKGWVRTESNEEDFRSTKVELTAEGRKLAGMLRQSTSKQLARAADGLSAADLRQLALILRRMTENLGRLHIE